MSEVTKGMTTGERIAHVGGVVNSDLTVTFGSVMAVDAMMIHLQNDLASEFRDLVELNNNLTSHRDELMAENAALREDAGRYRWMTEGAWIGERFNTAYREWDGSNGKEGFDAAIDAARKEIK